MFAVKTEEGRKGQDGQPSVGPVYRNPLAKDGFPPLDPGLSTTWDIFRYDTVPTLLIFAVLACPNISMLSSFKIYKMNNVQ